ncbi:hypothetical protein NX059_011383 [Plenodomus lindquistii]|nr:hypothetical protein NX059_011383 [Plenodomus lindquistii]
MIMFLGASGSLDNLCNVIRGNGPWAMTTLSHVSQDDLRSCVMEKVIPQFMAIDLFRSMPWQWIDMHRRQGHDHSMQSFQTHYSGSPSPYKPAGKGKHDRALQLASDA